MPLYQVWCFTGKALYNVVGLVMAAAKWAILSRLAQTLVGKLLPHHLPGPGQARIQCQGHVGGLHVGEVLQQTDYCTAGHRM